MTAESMWHWLNTNGTGLSAAVAVLTAAVAIVALIQTARDSRDRSRPMMLAEFRRAEHSHSTIDLVVRNAGPSVARDVQLSFDPHPVVPEDGDRYITTWLLQRYSKPLASVAPGQELSNIWFSGTATGATGNEMANREPTSEAVKVNITYKGSGRRRYSETYDLHVDTVRMHTFSVSSTSFPGRMESIVKSLSKLERSVESLANAVRQYRREQ